MFTLELTCSAADLEQIVALQHQNLTQAVAEEHRTQQGFVTLENTVADLERMRGPYRHVVAKADERVVGYALVMLRAHARTVDLLNQMIRQVDDSHFNGRPLKAAHYFVMGQVCVAKEFRAQGVFRALYDKLRAQMSPDFELVVTEVSKKNPRSMRAHERVGFRTLETCSPEWNVIVWDWQDAAPPPTE